MRHLENIVAMICLLGGIGTFWIFLERVLGRRNTCQQPCCKKNPKVTVISEGPGNRSLAEILNDPPKLKLDNPWHLKHCKQCGKECDNQWCGWTGIP